MKVWGPCATSVELDDTAAAAGGRRETTAEVPICDGFLFFVEEIVAFVEGWTSDGLVMGRF